MWLVWPASVQSRSSATARIGSLASWRTRRGVDIVDGVGLVGEVPMLRVWTAYQSRSVKGETGASMVEYALLAGFIAVAAGALLPGISTSISTIFSRMASVVSAAAAA